MLLSLDYKVVYEYQIQNNEQLMTLKRRLYVDIYTAIGIHDNPKVSYGFVKPLESRFASVLFFALLVRYMSHYDNCCFIGGDDIYK